MNEFAPGPEETGAEDWVEPSTSSEQNEEIPDIRAEIRARVEGGEEPLTPELYSQYQEIAEQIAFKTEGDFSLLQMEIRFEMAELFVAAGMKENAREALQEVADEGYQAGEKYDSFVAKVEARINELDQA